MVDKTENFQHLKCGIQYKVIKEFTDESMRLHPVGETWKYLSYSFLPYENGLTIFTDGDCGSYFRMRWTSDAQGPIIDALENYIKQT